MQTKEIRQLKNDIEDIYKEDAVRGTEVLLHSIIELADNSSKIINN